MKQDPADPFATYRRHQTSVPKQTRATHWNGAAVLHAACYLYVKTDLQLLFLSQVRDSELETKAADMIMPV